MEGQGNGQEGSNNLTLVKARQSGAFFGEPKIESNE
jgi:hypothetical protein